MWYYQKIKGQLILIDCDVVFDKDTADVVQQEKVEKEDAAVEEVKTVRKKVARKKAKDANTILMDATSKKKKVQAMKGLYGEGWVAGLEEDKVITLANQLQAVASEEARVDMITEFKKSGSATGAYDAMLNLNVAHDLEKGNNLKDKQDQQDKEDKQDKQDKKDQQNKQDKQKKQDKQEQQNQNKDQSQEQKDKQQQNQQKQKDKKDQQNKQDNKQQDKNNKKKAKVNSIKY